MLFVNLSVERTHEPCVPTSSQCGQFFMLASGIFAMQCRDARFVRPHTLEFSPESGGRTNRASLHFKWFPHRKKIDCRDVRFVQRYNNKSALHDIVFSVNSNRRTQQ